MSDIEEIAKNLHRLNFNPQDGILCPSKVLSGKISAENYSFNNIEENIVFGKPAHVFDGGCNYCKECVKDYADKLLYNETDTLEDKSAKYRFTSITHGAHTWDFLQAHDKCAEVKDWSTQPVLFVMENPGPYDDKGYYKTENRYLARWWYWINGQGLKENRKYKFKYPEWFVQKEYGWMIYSVINTFKIANAYVTNMVKCGIGSDNCKYKTTDYYNQKIVNKCVERYLCKELEFLRGENQQTTVIVFAFGQNTYYTLCEKLKDKNCEIYLLPHPANRLANDYRKYVLFGKIARALKLNHFYEGVKEIDYMSILTSDVEAVPDLKIKSSDLEPAIENIKETVIREKYESLQSFVESLKGIKRCNQYYCKTVSYIIEETTGGIVSNLTFMYKAPKGDMLEDGEHKVIWVKYCFSEDCIDTWVGKNNSADELIDRETAETFALYRLMKFIIKKCRSGK